jgi:dihydropteroate synthase
VRFSPPGRTESWEALLDGGAHALEARAALAGVPPGSWPGPEVRVRFSPDGLEERELQGLLESSGARVERSSGDGLALFTGPADGLAELARRLPGAARLAAAWAAAQRPPAPSRVMAVVNTTPDSFSDGGRFLDPARAIERGLQLIEAGADIVDVGGESTRPGAAPVSAAEELERVVPVIRALAGKAAVSVDTSKSEVAAAALDAGATIVNDVRAGTGDPALLSLIAERGAALVLVHMQGTPASMQERPAYADVTREVCRFLRERASAAWRAGIEPHRIALDPGLGFGKRLRHNLELLRALPELRSLGFPLVVGLSRKSFLGTLSGESRPERRDVETAAGVALAAHLGAEWHRVHDARSARAALAIAGGLTHPADSRDRAPES